MNFQKTKHFVRTACAAAVLAASAAAWGVEPFAVRDIRVEGLQRVEPGTVFATLPFRVGDTYNDDRGTQAIRALFALGLFADVKLEVADGNVLTIIVSERPVIADVEFSGIKEFDKDTLKKSLRDVGLADGRPYDKSVVDKAEQELKRQYLSRSLYAAEVVTTVTPTDRNRVNLTFTVTEGEAAKIRELRIVGAKAFSESTLLGLFELDSGGWLSWYTKNDRYTRAKLNADLETLRSYYLSRGYLEMRVDSTQVAISPDKETMTVGINITEGERFAVSGVRLEGNYLGKEAEFKTLVAVRPGEAYNADMVTRTQRAFTDYFATFGYAFARVEAVPQIDRVNNRVELVIQADPSRRAYVRKILVGGNSRTRDEVIRREFRQFEQSWYDGDKIKLSKDRLERLGFFKEGSVTFETQDVPGSPDQVDLLVNVVEKPTGQIAFGAGYSQGERLSFNASVKQDNVFGSGNFLAFEVNTSRSARAFSVANTDPYFTKDGISRTWELYLRNTKPLNADDGNYRVDTAGGGLRFGVPFSEFDTVFLGFTGESINIVPGSNIPATYLSYAENFGFRSTSFPITLGWARDNRDNLIAPSRGRLMRLNAEVSPVGDARYYRVNAQYQQYFDLSKMFTLAVNSEIAWGGGLNNRPYPVFKNYYGGGLGSVRGFEQSSLGPRDVTGSLIGGPKKFNANVEFLSGIPGAGADRSLRAFAFFDVGNVYGERDKFEFNTLRASYGVGIGWVSPLGPLRMAYALPVRKFQGDRIQRLQFQVGTSFQ
jgi:outer membrane protein insertion porin family